MYNMVMSYNLYACEKDFISQKIIEFTILEYVCNKCCFKSLFYFYQSEIFEIS